MDVPAGATVGVVLLGPGGPETHSDVPSFLYRQYMDPAVSDVRLGSWMHHLISRFVARRRSETLRREYEAIGGRAPVLRHAGDLSRMLERYLAQHHGHDVRFRVFLAMRYGDPSPQQTIRALRAEGIRHVVLLPLYPQYADATTGSSLAFWRAAAQREEADIDTVVALAYPDEPDFVQAVSERIDEALQRFPRSVRADVQYLFVAHGTAPRGRRARCAPYCCHVHRTVNAVMALRGQDRPFEVTFQSQPGLPDRLMPRLADVVDRLGQEGRRAVLVVPIAFTTEQLDTAFRLEVTMRSRAERSGIAHYEVATPLNCHPLFIRAMAEVTAERVVADGRPVLERVSRQWNGSCPRGGWTGEGAFSPGFEARCRHCEFAEGSIGQSLSASRNGHAA